MVASVIVNTILVLLGYYLGLKKARDDIQGMINSNVELQELWSRLLMVQAEEAEDTKKEATGDAEAPPEASEAEEVAEAPEAEEIIAGRVFKSFNLYNNIGATEPDQKKR